jgi:cyclopropane fatty-acyl-phospholipid synthase-like methyltransferase
LRTRWIAEVGQKHFRVGSLARMRILDVGCGAGLLSESLAALVKVSGRRPSQVVGLGAGRRTETAHVRTRGQHAMRLWGFEDFRAVLHTLRAQR